MEVWLKDDIENIMFRFPVIPMPLGKGVGASVDTVGIVKYGNIAIYNGKEPGTVKLDSFFPKHYHQYCNYRDFPSPYECVDIIEKWVAKGRILRYIVTGTPVNMPVVITGFDYHHKDGTGSLYYTLQLIEKDVITIPTWTPPQEKKTTNNTTKKGSAVVKNDTRANASNNHNRRVHIVKKGEYLYMLGQKYYGNGNKYKLIKNNVENQANYPKLKKSNYIYVGWKLVIP